jgi:DNA-binding beta-propeller fold protein YncE
LLRVLDTRIQLLNTISVKNARQGIDSRGIAFNPSGTRAYIANRSTPSILVYDVSCGPDGREVNQLLDIIDVGLDPGAVAYLRRDDGQDRIYVTCATSMEVYVIDPFLDRVDTIIEVGEGAYDITFTRGARERRGVQRAYVANFQEDSISVIDLDQTSPNYHREIARWRASPRLLP